MGHGSQVVATIAALEKDVAHRLVAGADRVHLGVGRDVGRQHHRVVLAGDHAVADGDGAAKGALPAGQALAARVDGHLHQFFGRNHGHGALRRRRSAAGGSVVTQAYQNATNSRLAEPSATPKLRLVALVETSLPPQGLKTYGAHLRCSRAVRS